MLEGGAGADRSADEHACRELEPVAFAAGAHVVAYCSSAVPDTTAILHEPAQAVVSDFPVLRAEVAMLLMQACGAWRAVGIGCTHRVFNGLDKMLSTVRHVSCAATWSHRFCRNIRRFAYRCAGRPWDSRKV